MKRIVVATVLILLSGCVGFPPEPLRYVAVDMPENIAPSERSGYFRVDRHRAGLLFRPPQDVASLLRELHEKSQSTVMRDVDVSLEMPFCIYVVCAGTDSADGFGSAASQAGNANEK